MTGQNIVELTRAATRFRQMIENADRAKLPIEFENFPTGSCGSASRLLAQYLIDGGLDAPNYVVGDIVEPTKSRSHAWLELDGVVIDITADGFDPDMPKVVVTKGSSWHHQFRIRDEHLPAINLYEDRPIPRLAAAYQELTG